MWFRSASIVVLGLVLAPQPSDSCTAFCTADAAGHAVLAKSFDFHFGNGAVYINKVGTEKTAFSNDAEPFKWTADHASVTFNQFGQELPNGGMNDAGLVGEVLWLPKTRYPPADSRKALNELQWLQYQLDKYESVQQVIEHVDEHRVTPLTPARVHYFVCDKTRECAAIEFFGGATASVSRTGEQMTYRALANSRYQDSRDAAAAYQPFGGEREVPENDASVTRFLHGARAAGTRGDDAIARAFASLSDVHVKDWTRWHIVYEPHAGRVHFRTMTKLAIKTLELGQFPRHCEDQGAMTLPLSHEARGDTTDAFRPATPRAHAALFRASAAEFQEIFGPLAPDLVTKGAAYARVLRCKLKDGK